MTVNDALVLDYEFQSQYYERRLQHLLETIWEEYGALGYATSRNYIIAVSYE
jgi:hypothetical protein